MLHCLRPDAVKKCTNVVHYRAVTQFVAPISFPCRGLEILIEGFCFCQMVEKEAFAEVSIVV